MSDDPSETKITWPMVAVILIRSETFWMVALLALMVISST